MSTECIKTNAAPANTEPRLGDRRTGLLLASNSAELSGDRVNNSSDTPPALLTIL